MQCRRALRAPCTGRPHCPCFRPTTAALAPRACLNSASAEFIQTGQNVPCMRIHIVVKGGQFASALRMCGTRHGQRILGTGIFRDAIFRIVSSFFFFFFFGQLVHTVKSMDVDLWASSFRGSDSGNDQQHLNSWMKVTARGSLSWVR